MILTKCIQFFHQVFKALFDIVLSLDHDHDREIKTAPNNVNFNHSTAKKLKKIGNVTVLLAKFSSVLF